MLSSSHRRSNSLRIVVFNARGVAKQKAELTNFLKDNDIDICLLTETFLKPRHKFTIPNYKVHRTDRLTADNGGTAVLVRRSIQHYHTPVPVLNSLECTAVTVVEANREMVLVSNYKQPKVKLDTTDIDSLRNLSRLVFLGGDFNCKHTDWNCRTTNANGVVLRDYLATTTHLHIKAPDEPTHYPDHPHHIPDILDVALVQNWTFPTHIKVIRELDSDHVPVIFSITTGVTHTTRTKLTAHDYNWATYRDYVTANYTQMPLDSPECIDAAVTGITKVIQGALLKACKRTVTRPYTKPIPRDILLLIRHKNRLRKDYQRTGYPPLKTEINKIRKDIAERLKANYVGRLEHIAADNQNPYKVPNTFLNTHSEIPILNSNNQHYATNLQKAEIVAEQFAKQFCPNPIPPNTRSLVEEALHNTSSPVEVREITEEEVKLKLRYLKVRKATGSDNIPNFALKLLPDSTITQIVEIYNSCLRISHFPTSWKLAKIIPIHKSGKPKDQPSSYRPISLLNSLSKIFESIILDRMQAHEEEFQIPVIPHSQFGFRREHSTTMVLSKITELITTNFNRKTLTGLVSLDVEKAFDKVWHPGLLHKLQSLNFPSYLTHIIKSYLSNRSFFVQIGQDSSPLHPISSGVPQGSSLGPHLFNLYLSDIPQPTDHRVIVLQYADDTAIIASSKSEELMSTLLEEATDEVIDFFEEWGLSVNTAKSAAICFTRRRIGLPDKLLLTDGDIKFQDKLKYLGLTLDSRLSFSAHIANITKNYLFRNSQLYPILSTNIPTKTGSLIYKTYLRPLLTYAALAWYPLISKTDKQKLQRLQNRTLRLITKQTRYTRITEIHDITPICTLYVQFSTKVSLHYLVSTTLEKFERMSV